MKTTLLATLIVPQKDIGVSVNEPINVSSKPVAIALATAIVGVELGYQPYSPKSI